MPVSLQEVCWPAVLHCTEDPELLPFSDATSWEFSEALHNMPLRPDDRLIDSNGQVYHLQRRSAAAPELQSTQTVLGLNEVLGLVKAHAAQGGSCCVARLYAPSIAAALRLVCEQPD